MTKEIRCIILNLILCSVFFASCKKESPQPPAKSYDHRDYKVGTYRVQTDSGSYEIRIEKLDSLNSVGDTAYYIKFYNILDLFPITYANISDIKNSNYQNSVNFTTLYSNGVMIPYFDKQGNRWYASSYYDTIDGVEYGKVSNDTLRLYVHINNIKYRIADKVPYMERYVKVEGVRVK